MTESVIFSLLLIVGMATFCTGNVCPNSFRQPPFDIGKIECGPRKNYRQGSWAIGSRCQLKCNDGFGPKYSTEISECVRGRFFTGWTVSEMCCVECLPNIDLDIVFLLDRTVDSEHFSANTWENRVDFAVDFTNFLAEEYDFDVNMTVIPFGKTTSVESTEFFSVDYEQLLNDEIRGKFKQYSSTEMEDSNAGYALDTVAKNIFGFHNYRSPMIFMVTTRAPSDLDDALRAAEELSSRNIHMRIFPITNHLVADARPNKEVFTKIAGSNGFVLDYADENHDPTYFYIEAAMDLITATIKHCNARPQGLQHCMYE